MNEEEFQRIQQLRFEHAVEGMLDQDVQAQAMGPGMECMYITQAGLRCAVGHCLTERGAELAERKGVGSHPENIKQVWFKPELRFGSRLSVRQKKRAEILLETLQAIHDHEEWRDYAEILKVAESNNLDPGILVTWIYDDD